MDNKPENQGKTWFWRWFLDNQLVSGLLILSLLLINLILFSQTSYLFNPLKDFISAIGVPVACGAVIYYLVKPIYDYYKPCSNYSKAIIRFSITTAILLSNY